jgi:hypothetical protein
MTWICFAEVELLVSMVSGSIWVFCVLNSRRSWRCRRFVGSSAPIRREGIIGAIEIILHHEPRELGG